MKTIWKYELDTVDNQLIEMPLSARILTVQTQNEKPCLWCLTYPNIPKEVWKKREIIIHGTGHDVEAVPGEYIGTYQLLNGALVYHVFDKGFKI